MANSTICENIFYRKTDFYIIVKKWKYIFVENEVAIGLGRMQMQS
jgi:hypothetical protein